MQGPAYCSVLPHIAQGLVSGSNSQVPGQLFSIQPVLTAHILPVSEVKLN